MSLFVELRRRNVFKVGAAYLVGAWLLLQVADLVLENIGAPQWVMQSFMLLLGVGFPVAVIVAWAFEVTPEGIKREADVDRSDSITPQTGKKLNALIIAMLAIAVAYLLWDKFAPGPDEAPSVAAPESVGAETGEPSVAVLPFANISGDPDNEYFSDGLTETLLHMLAQLPDLQVAARTSSFAFKGQNIAIGEIAAALGVAHVLEGSVQRSGERVRVTAQLVRADDGFHVWSQNYTRPLEDIFAIQDEIAADVASALGASLLGRDGSPQHGVATDSIDAYDFFLRGLEQQAIHSYASLPIAEGLFKQALAEDPGFIEAKLSLARNYTMMQGTGLIDDQQMYERVEPLLAQVRTASPNNAYARAIELQMRLQVPELISGEERRQVLDDLRDLLTQIPEDSYARRWVSAQLSFWYGEEEAALEVADAGLLVDPLNDNLHMIRGDVLASSGRLDEAEAAYLRSIELDPQDPGAYHRLSTLASLRNDVVSFLDWRRRSIEVDPQDHELVTVLATQFYMLGLPEEGDFWAQRVAALAPGSDFERHLQLVRAYTLAEWDEARVIAEGLIESGATLRLNILPNATGGYAEMMLRHHGAHEGYEFIMSLRPELANFSAPPTDIQGMLMQWSAVALMTEIEDFETRKQAWISIRDHWDSFGFPWRTFSVANQIFDKIMIGEVDEGVRIALEEHLTQPLTTYLNRVEDLQGVVYGPVAEDPQVAARMQELLAEKEQMRQQVSEMLRQPEWSQ